MANLQEIIEGLKKIPTASIADAVDQVVGIRGFMSCEMKPIFDCKVVGPAVTVKEVVSLKNEGPKQAIECIETAEEGSVLVISCEDGKEVAIFGGLMGTGCKVRGLAGAVLDGGCRDVAELKDLGFPVFSSCVIPSTTLGRRITVDHNVPIDCAGVRVYPGDLIVGDTDGVVVIPKDYLEEVYQKALEIEKVEKQQTADIWELKSLKQAIEKWARI